MGHLKTGDKAPLDFTLKNTAYEEVELNESVDSGPVVLVFFRSYWCGYCAEQLKTYNRLAYDLWTGYHADIFPISRNSVSTLNKMKNGLGLRFELFSDPDLSVTTAYTDTEDVGGHVVSRPGYDKIPIPSTFIIDADSTIRYAQVAERPDDRTTASFVRNFLTETEQSKIFEDIYKDTYPHPYSK